MPYPIFISFMALLYILYLLADLLDLGLHIDHDLGDIQILSLRTDRIYLTVHFLYYEIQLSANCVITGKHSFKL